METNKMHISPKDRIAWTKGKVNKKSDHLKIHYGKIKNPVALVGHKTNGNFTVEFLLKNSRTNPYNEKVLNAVQNELTFYLLKCVGPDSWPFAQYHCTTLANRLSMVHWSWHPRLKE